MLNPGLKAFTISWSVRDRVVCNRIECSVNVLLFIVAIQFLHLASSSHGQTKKIKGENIVDR